jgi:hypothetical protein
MDDLFVIKTKLNQKHYYEFYKTTSGVLNRSFTIVVFALFMSISIYFIFCAKLILFATFLGFALFYLCSSIIVNMNIARKKYRYEVKLNNGVDPQQILCFSNDIRGTIANNVYSSFDYSHITRIYETKKLLILQMAKLGHLILDLNGFSTGTPDEFKKFIRDKCPNARYILHRESFL